MKKICKICREFKEVRAYGLCDLCYAKKWYSENEEKAKATRRKWQKENPERTNAANRKYRKENPEKIKAGSKKYYIENLEKAKAARKKWYLENSERVRAAYRKYRLENPEKRKAICKKWYLENPGKIREYKLKRRGYGAPKKGVVDRIINENILKYGIITCEKDKKSCPDNFHIDHIIPVSRGGTNDYNNLQILCSHCNQSKHIETADYKQINKNNQMFLKIGRN